jgi:hypothetical protein
MEIIYQVKCLIHNLNKGILKMGMHFHSYVFYGFELKNERDDFYDLMEETWEPDSKVLIDSVGDGDFYYLCIRESHITASEYDGEPVFIQLAETNKADWDYELYQFCMEHNLIFLQPTWTFAAGFS